MWKKWLNSASAYFRQTQNHSEQGFERWNQKSMDKDLDKDVQDKVCSMVSLSLWLDFLT